MAHEGAWVHGVLCRCEPAHPGQAVMVVVREMAREGQQLFKKSIRVTFIPGNGFGRAGVDSEPERGGPPSVGKPGDLQLGFAIGAGVLEHLICGRRADRPTFRDISLILLSRNRQVPGLATGAVGHKLVDYYSY